MWLFFFSLEIASSLGNLFIVRQWVNKNLVWFENEETHDLLFSATPKARDIHKNEYVTDRIMFMAVFFTQHSFVYFSFDNATTLFGCPVIWAEKKKKHVKLFSP